jgi:hypothetical protein
VRPISTPSGVRLEISASKSCQYFIVCYCDLPLLFIHGSVTTSYGLYRHDYIFLLLFESFRMMDRLCDDDDGEYCYIIVL